MNFKAIIFDMDGTIIDSDRAFEYAVDTLISRRGIICNPDMRQEIEKRTKGISLPYSCAIIKDMLNIEGDLEALILEKRALAHELFEKEAEFITGFTTFHAGMSGKNYGLRSAIATNADDYTLALAKQKFKLDRYFGNHIYNISCVQNRYKPDPALYLHTAERLELNPADCIAIEDSYYGIAAAKAAGMYCIGINTAGKPEQLAQSDSIINGYDEINLNTILQINRKSQ